MLKMSAPTGAPITDAVPDATAAATAHDTNRATTNEAQTERTSCNDLATHGIVAANDFEHGQFPQLVARDGSDVRKGTL